MVFLPLHSIYQLVSLVRLVVQNTLSRKLESPQERATQIFRLVKSSLHQVVIYRFVPLQNRYEALTCLIRVRCISWKQRLGLTTSGIRLDVG